MIAAPSMSVPLVILGGGDSSPGELPPLGRGKQLLAGVKAIDVRIGGRLLIDRLLERYRGVGFFDPIYIAGPRDAYRKAGVEAEIIDTDAGFGGNIQAGLRAMAARHPNRIVAMSTCDILPDTAELETLLQDYRSQQPCDLWFPLIRAPEDPRVLGASSWKPRYTVTGPNGIATPVLPSHLAVFDPSAMRLEFLYKLLDGAYRTRNRPVLVRRSYLLRRLLGGLLIHDLRHLLTFRLPNVTWDVVRHGYFAARRLRDGIATQTELEYALRQMFTKRAHRSEHPDRRMRLPILDGLSLARDIDTVEEARALESSAPARWAGSPL